MASEKSDSRETSLLKKLSLPEAAAPPWSLATALLTAAVMFICLALIGPALASLILGLQEASPTLLMLSWTIGMAATAIFTLVNRRGAQESWTAMRWTKGTLPQPYSMLLGLAVALFINLLISLPSAQFLPLPEVYGIQTGTASLAIAAILLVCAQPIAETCVFQAVLLPSLRWTLGPWLGLLATCLLYTLIHVFVFHAPYQQIYDPLWYGLVYPFITCLAFCIIKISNASTRSVLIARISAGLVFLLTSLILSA